MKLGIIGLPMSGRATVFAALTGARGEDTAQSKKDQRIGTVKVVDDRINFLADMYQPQKTAFAQVEYLLPSDLQSGGSSKSENAAWNQARVCDALIHVVRNFQDAGGTAPCSEEDFRSVDEDMILGDLVVVEKRLERLELDGKRGRKPDKEEIDLLNKCKILLDDSKPIRLDSDLAFAPLLRGFTFLSSKPQLVIINNSDEDDTMPRWRSIPKGVEMLEVRGKLEMDIASMEPEEAEEFFAEYNIETSALDRVIKCSYEIQNLMSFFTVGSDEVKAWTIKKETPALDAAGEIHSDIQKGFIRAEVLAYRDLIDLGSFAEAKKAGRVRLEGKEYIVQDGDIINFRFNV